MCWLLVLLLFVGNSSCLVWRSLILAEETFENFEKVGKDMISSINEEFETVRIDLEQFINRLDNGELGHAIQTLSTEKCPLNVDFNALIESLRVQVNLLEVPLKDRSKHLEEKYLDFRVSINVYKRLADSRWWACKMAGKDCSENIENWLSSELSPLTLQLSSDSRSHSIRKRSYTYEYTCPSGGIIPLSLVNDGVWDCPDGSDEYIASTALIGEYLTSTERSNPQQSVCYGKFNCSIHPQTECIELDKVCDGSKDCSNGVDELGCPKSKRCDANLGDFQCGDKACIPMSDVCDGTADCEDGSDEEGECGLGSCDKGCMEGGGVCFLGSRGPLCLSQCPSATYDSPLGCLTGRSPSNSSISDLLDDIPRLARRQVNAYYRLRKKAEDMLNKALIDGARCRGGYFSDVGRAYILKNDKNHNNTNS